MNPMALVTGAGSGFGFETVKALLKQNWRVLAGVKNLDVEAEHFKELQDQYPHTLIVKQLDITLPEQRLAIVQAVNDQFGHLDLLVNNAGFGTYGALYDLSEDQIRYQFEVNFFGPLLFTQLLIPVLQSGGKIINVTSIMARYSMPLVSMYSASKYALEGAWEGIYQELAILGIQSCTVQPGGYRTAFYKSLTWGKSSFAETSPYRDMGLHFQNFMRQLAQRPKAPDPQDVANEIVKLAGQSQLPRTCVIGKDAKLIALLQRVLPYVWFHRVMNLLHQKILGPFKPSKI